MIDKFWILGEPKQGGFYLILTDFCGNPWVEQAQVVFCEPCVTRAVYMNGRGGGYASESYSGAKVVAHCDPELFEKAFLSILAFYSTPTESRAGYFQE